MAAKFFEISMFTFENKFRCVSKIIVIALISLYLFVNNFIEENVK